MEGIPQPIIRIVEEFFGDFKGRRAGLIKALTIDVAKLYQQCDPEKENLCLYGLPNETWKVDLPVEEVPSVLPEPALVINLARNGMQERDWLSLVAMHSDSWLLAVAFYFGARYGFGKNERKKLFQLINSIKFLSITLFHFLLQGPGSIGAVERAPERRPCEFGQILPDNHKIPTSRKLVSGISWKLDTGGLRPEIRSPLG
ncbi:PHD finger protein ALFIN-LIKE 7-like [Pistacia vera]|uniref:PHD finger protein ALFIN-LIKE 7-like n=1 Tax=Pistacia vera TaxID=55513 RepID=UPI001263042A|nr:PHD finger protein ALFIN-LIKE 7-like [Pistacia vera]